MQAGALLSVSKGAKSKRRRERSTESLEDASKAGDSERNDSVKGKPKRKSIKPISTPDSRAAKERRSPRLHSKERPPVEMKSYASGGVEILKKGTEVRRKHDPLSEDKL